MGGQVAVVGPFSPGQGQQLVQDGIITGGFMWNPAGAGRGFVTLGSLLADRVEITDGMEIPGLGVVNPDFETGNIITDNLLELNKNSADGLAATGL